VTSVHNTLFSLQPTNSRIVLELLEIAARVHARQKSHHGGHQRRRNLAHRRPTSTFQCHEARAGQKAQEISLTFLLNPETRRFSFRFKKKIDLTFHIFKTPKIILPSTSKAETSRPASSNHGFRPGANSTKANTTREGVRSRCCCSGHSPGGCTVLQCCSGAGSRMAQNGQSHLRSSKLQQLGQEHDHPKVFAKRGLHPWCSGTWGHGIR
jgi:hypothetical protein